MALTDTMVRLAKAGGVDRKLADEKGLYLLVTVTGSKLWRLKYRINGKEKKLSLGSYPVIAHVGGRQTCQATANLPSTRARIASQ